MFLVRDIMFCKPGQARPMVQKFLALDKLGRQIGFGPMRVMTDLSALIKPGSTSLTVFFANDINSREEITAQAFNANGQQRAVLLIPCNQQHSDNKGCAGAQGAIPAFSPRPPWPVLPDQVRARLQEGFGFGRLGAR